MFYVARNEILRRTEVSWISLKIALSGSDSFELHEKLRTIL